MLALLASGDPSPRSQFLREFSQYLVQQLDVRAMSACVCDPLRVSELTVVKLEFAAVSVTRHSCDE